EVSDGGSFINETNATIEIISNDNNSDNARNVIGIIIDSGDDDDDHFKTTAENKGVITISVTENRWGTGMLAKGEKAEIKNSGTINLSGDNLYGMLAYYGATATNEKTGIINVGGNSTGMLAYGEGSKIINLGTINVDKDNLNNSSENGVLNSAMKIENGATLENKGIINSESDVKIEIKNGGAYVVGTDRNGSYGKISAENINIDGKIKVSTEIAKGSYKDSYKLEDVLSAETITLDSKATSTSVLYDAKLEENKDGNVDATLSKNKSKVSDYTNTSFISTAKIFDKYFSDNEYNKLEDDQKEVIDTLFEYTSETEIENGGLNKALKSLTPTIYSNLGRQILETSETFKAQDTIAINSIGENSYNFTFLGEYRDVDSRKNIEGYESKLSGFVGAMSFGDGTYGTLGYGHNSIDYDDNGSGKIETIHLGLNRYSSYSGLDIKLGLGGEYNFHENKRDIDLLNRKAESDFDSYGVRGSAEVSKKIGDKTYLKPFLGLDLAYMKYDEFSESGAGSINTKIESQKYTSLLPKVGTTLGLDFDKLSLYSSVEYSYELGDMEKDIDFNYEGFDGVGKLEKDELECGTTSLKAGANYKIASFSVRASIGKNFGKRDNLFGNVSLGYTF
ncbi:MAG: autotransporter outer membrane beta-barrel domain-containing protein, partial [Fusobacteriaceae bacterium]